jgi:hypothetical protein
MALHVEAVGPWHAIGSDGALLVCLMKKPIDAAVGEQLGAAIERQLRQHRGRIAYLHVTSLETGGAADVAEVRTHYGALVRRFAGARGPIAFVAENEGFASALARSAFTAVMALAPKSITGRAFASVPPAADWLDVAARDEQVGHAPLAREVVDMVGRLRALPTASQPR